MSSRERILQAVAKNQPELEPLQQIPEFATTGSLIDNFVAASGLIGSRTFRISALSEIEKIIEGEYLSSDRILSLLPELSHFTHLDTVSDTDPHTLANVKLALIKGHFGVAENSAIWVTEQLVGQRVLPFVTEHLAIVINLTDIVATMHQAYQRIADQEYGYGAFIAGPSKTADIEQSLVRGAHGPRSLTIFLLD
jgi:L-lactate dehydrogenase complex protein LldG